MLRRQRASGLLIAVELGAEWPAGFAGDVGVVRRVVAQGEGETPEAFAARFGAVLGQLFPAGAALRDAVIACNERTDAAATVARRSIGNSVLERIGPSGTCVFAASGRAGGRLRHALSALAIDFARAGGAKVTVHFDPERAEDGAEVVARVA